MNKFFLIFFWQPLFFAMAPQEPTNAGILPYAFHEDKVYFLFGKEDRPTAGFVWLDFGGKKDPDDVTKAATFSIHPLTYAAAREFSEETAYAFGNYSLLKNNPEGYIESAIGYAISKILNKKFFVVQNNDYRAIFLQVDYKTADAIKKLKEDFIKRGFKVTHSVEEKKDFRWLSADKLYNMLKLNREQLFDDDGALLYRRYRRYLTNDIIFPRIEIFAFNNSLNTLRQKLIALQNFRFK